MGLRRRLGTKPTDLFEVVNGAVGLPASHEHIHQFEPDGDIGRNQAEDLSQLLLVHAHGTAVPALCVELSERVEHLGVAPQLAEGLARFVGSSGERIEPGGDESDLGVGRIQPARAAQLGFGLRIVTAAQVGEAQVRVSERISRSERHDLFEFHFCLRQPAPLEVGEPEVARGEECLLVDRLRPAAGRGHDQRRAEDDGERPLPPRQRGTILRPLLHYAFE